MGQKTTFNTSGFTLVELSIVLVIIGVFTGAMVGVAGSRIEAQRISDTKQRMQYIENAIDRYVRKYGNLPCPANPAILPGGANHGVGQGTNLPTASGGAGTPFDTPACVGSIASTDNVFIGAVPYVDLDISAQVASDSWEDLFTYAVDGDLTFTGQAWSAESVTTLKYGFANNGDPTFYDVFGGSANFTNRLSTQGSIQIRNFAGDIIEPRAAYVLISHGANGWGAITRDGTSLGTGTASVSEQENINTAGANNVTFLQRTPARDFDDFVIYKAKWQLVRE